MLSTVSLIDPTTLNPSFSDSSRIGRPAVIVTRADQQTAVDQFQQLLTHAKAYRLQMLALSKAAASFGYSLEKIAHSKTAIMDPSNVGSSLQAAAGLHYLMSNHHQILSDTVYKQFEIPLLQHLDTHKANIEASEAQYERSMRDMSQKIKETEAASLQNGRKRQRDLLQFRQALTTLTMQVDELERIKLGYYFSNLESEQANLQLILQKTSTIVRAEVDIYERIANKGLNDLILEPMTTQGPDPYCTYPTTDEFSSIFSILPPTPIIPTSGPGAAAANTTANSQPDPMSTYYGYHEVNPFSTARAQATAANRHLFGEASSAESKASMMNKAAILTTSAATAAVASAAAASKADKLNTDQQQQQQQQQNVATTSAHSSTTVNQQVSSKQETLSNGHIAQSPEADVNKLSIQTSSAVTGTGKDNDASSVTQTKVVDYFRAVRDPHREGSTDSESSPANSSTSATQGVNLRSGQHHHRNHQSRSHSKHIDDSPGPSSSMSEPSSSVPSYSLHRSRSGSRSHMMLASTPDSPPVRTGIHIGQDSELLNNRDFSFSYEPSELLEHRSHHTHHLHHSHSREFHGFDELEEENQALDGFRSSLPPRLLHSKAPEHDLEHAFGQESKSAVPESSRETEQEEASAAHEEVSRETKKQHQGQEQEQKQEQEQEQDKDKQIPKDEQKQQPSSSSSSPPPSSSSSSSSSQSQTQNPVHELRHASSQGAINRGSSTNLSILGSSTGSFSGSPRQNGIISGIATSILRSSGRIRSSAASSFVGGGGSGSGHQSDSESHGHEENMDPETRLLMYGPDYTAPSSLTSNVFMNQQSFEEMADHMRELGRGFDEGIPAFSEDEPLVIPVRRNSQERERGSFMIGALENSGFGQESNSSEDLRKLDGEDIEGGDGVHSNRGNVLGKKTSSESIRMADGSCKEIS